MGTSERTRGEDGILKRRKKRDWRVSPEILVLGGNIIACAKQLFLPSFQQKESIPSVGEVLGAGLLSDYGKSIGELIDLLGD